MSRQDLTLEFVNKIGRFVCPRKCNCQISTEVNQTILMLLLFYYYYFYFYFFILCILWSIRIKYRHWKFYTESLAAIFLQPECNKKIGTYVRQSV